MRDERTIAPLPDRSQGAASRPRMQRSHAYRVL